MRKRKKAKREDIVNALVYVYKSLIEYFSFPSTEEYEIMTQKANQTFYLYNWFFSVNTSNLKEIYNFIISNESKEDFQNVLDTYLIKKSEEMLFFRDSLILYSLYGMENFADILKELEQNYISGKYYSCVSLGLILINYLYNKIDGIKKNTPNGLINFISNKIKLINKKGFFTYYNSKFDKLFEKTIYKKEITNKKEAENYTEDIVNRHKLFHGWDIDFGTQKNAINILLIIDFLLKFYERENK